MLTNIVFIGFISKHYNTINPETILSYHINYFLCWIDRMII